MVRHGPAVHGGGRPALRSPPRRLAPQARRGDLTRRAAHLARRPHGHRGHRPAPSATSAGRPGSTPVGGRPLLRAATPRLRARGHRRSPPGPARGGGPADHRRHVPATRPGAPSVADRGHRVLCRRILWAPADHAPRHGRRRLRLRGCGRADAGRDADRPRDREPGRPLGARPPTLARRARPLRRQGPGRRSDGRDAKNRAASAPCRRQERVGGHRPAGRVPPRRATATGALDRRRPDMGEPPSLEPSSLPHPAARPAPGEPGLRCDRHGPPTRSHRKVLAGLCA